jgi:hypothetical protein
MIKEVSTVVDLISLLHGGLQTNPRDVTVKLDARHYDKKEIIVDPTIFIGLEIEIERVEFTEHVHALSIGQGYLWRNTEDGSLRNNGREFVSIPMRGEVIPAALSRLRETLNTLPMTKGYEFSDRTSVHVHMNAQDCTLDEVLSFLYLYILVEPLLYEYAGRERFDSIFCVPITESALDSKLALVCEALKTQNLHDVIHEIQGWMKYTGLNLLPLVNYGTIEFRHLNGTLDNTRLMTWINLILSLRKFTKGLDSAKLLVRFLEMNTNSEYTHFLQEVFGDLYHTFDVHNIQQMLEPSVTFLKDISHTIKRKYLIDAEKFCEQPQSNNLINFLIKKGYSNSIDIDEKIKYNTERIAIQNDSIIKLQNQIDNIKERIKRENRTSTESETKLINVNAKSIKSLLHDIMIYEKSTEAYKRNPLDNYNGESIYKSAPLNKIGRDSVSVTRMAQEWANFNPTGAAGDWINPISAGQTLRDAASRRGRIIPDDVDF